MELKDTVAMMESSDYKERLKAEYYQLKIRADKLEDMCVKYAADKLDFEPTCDLELLEGQLEIMREYLYVLRIRAAVEEISLSD